MRKGYAVVVDHMMTKEEANIGGETGPDMLFVLHMGSEREEDTYYFNGIGLDMLCRMFQRIELTVRESVNESED